MIKSVNLKSNYLNFFSPKTNEKNQNSNTGLIQAFSKNPLTNKSAYNISFTSIYSHGATNLAKNRNISFKGILDSDYSYKGDPNPLKKILGQVTRNGENAWHDSYGNGKFYHAGHKKWYVDHPVNTMKRPLQDAIMCVENIAGRGCLPNDIKTPYYNNNWGRRARYFEINPRAIAEMDNGRIKNGIYQAMKFIPAVPASPDGIAHCVILSQLFPTHGTDGRVDNNQKNGLYSVNINAEDNYGISRNLIPDGGLKAQESVKAFNDLAHLKGLKTGIRMPLYDKQIKLNGHDFNWNSNWDKDKYVQACCYAVNLGFDAIYFDSAKHVGGYDPGNTDRDWGTLPSYDRMQGVTQQIKQQTGRMDLSFIGEKANDHIEHFKNLGLNAGTDWSKADSYTSVRDEAKKQNWSHDYAAGPDVSNDNSDIGLSWDQRLARAHNALNGSEQFDKLPVFFQMDDLWPMTVGTHTLMEKAIAKDSQPEWHWNKLFVHGSEGADWYSQKLNEIFVENAKK